MLQPSHPKSRVAIKFDVFQFCRFLRVVGHVMVLVVLGLVTMVYMAVWVSYAPRLSVGKSTQKILPALIIICFSFLCCMLLWSYAVAAFSDPGSVPPGWHPFSTQQEEEAMRNRILQQSQQLVLQHKSARYCRKCHSWKPQRTHHCSIMGRCVLKMDHFCLWIVNTVGLLNYKAFLLFLLYSMLTCAFAFATLLPAGLRLIRLHQVAGRDAGLVFMSTVLSFVFTLALMLFIGMHWDMVAHNYTSIETLDHNTTQPWVWDKGIRRNMEEVFGRRRNWWWMPALSKHDTEWMMGQALESRSQSSSFHHDRDTALSSTQEALDRLV